MRPGGVSCRELGLHCKTHRPVLPELSESLIEVSGRDGAYDYGNNNYRNRLVTVDFFISPRQGFENFRLDVRRVAAWLRRKGEIRFSDEPDKYYVGRCYQSPDLEQATSPAGSFSAQFVCEPFAYGAAMTQELVSDTPATIPIDYPGTYPACTTIIIRNAGSTPVQGIRIRHNIESD